MSEKIFLGSNVGDLETGDVPANITRVNLSVDSDHYYTAGDDTGRAIEVTCPWGSQEMANSILASVSGKTYQPYTATDALLDPAAEIGDAVTLGGYYSVIADISTSFDRASAPTISAPGADEIDDEYPYESRERRETNRQLAQTRSLISKTSEEILLQVENELKGLSSSFSVQIDNITGRVNGLDGEFAELSLTLDGLTVTDPTGKTVINGSMIQTSNLYVNAANINGTLQANQINLTGAITWSDLASDAQGKVNSASSLASTANQNATTANNTISGWKYQGTTYIDGTKLMTGTVTASTIQGGQIALMATEDIQAGILGLTAASTAGIAVNLASLGALRLRANQGDIYISRDEGSYPTFLHFQDRDIAVGVNNYTTQLATFRPNMDDVFNLGDSSHAWKRLYLASPIISSSDRRRKAEISYELERYDAVFDALKPASFLLLRHEGDGKHVGFVAQDVEEALSSAGLERGDLAALVCENDVYALRYEEFIPLCVRQIQQLKARVAALEGEGGLTKWKN